MHTYMCHKKYTQYSLQINRE